MTIDELSLWLSNHPEIGPDYQEEIDILKGSKVHNHNYCCEELNPAVICTLDMIAGAKVNGRGFLSLNESKLEKLKVSYGFQLAVLDVIDELKGYVHDVTRIHSDTDNDYPAYSNNEA